MQRYQLKWSVVLSKNPMLAYTCKYQDKNYVSAKKTVMYKCHI